jgi:hypothetical protein
LKHKQKLIARLQRKLTEREAKLQTACVWLPYKRIETPYDSKEFTAEYFGDSPEEEL